MQKILKFQPIYKEKIWGGRKLETHLKRNLPQGSIGESWEISDYGNDISIITNGEFKGKSFRECYQKYPKEILGENFDTRKGFPLLIKIIDASQKLSIQVHPDDAYTLQNDPVNSGKKEAWYILQSDPGSSIICGFAQDTNRQEYEKLIAENNAENILQNISPNAGDAFLINPGTIHGIGGGNLILEIQQSSDSTYRVYDYGRLEKDGQPRKLHLEKALDVLNFSKSKKEEFLFPKRISNNRFLLAETDKFRLEIFEIDTNQKITSLYNQRLFQIIHVVEGTCEIESMQFQKGDTFLITASAMKEGLEVMPGGTIKLAVMGAKESRNIQISIN